MNALQYQINIRWSELDQAYEATIPALKGCLAYGDTPEEAAHEVRIAAELWLEAAESHAKPIPRPDATLERLSALAPILNLSALARSCSIPVQTIATKIKRGTPLNDREREAISNALASHGLA